MGTVLINGRVVTPEETVECDIRIENEVIESIGKNLIKENDKVIDVKGAYILPGAIDTHTHFDLDTGTTFTADNFETGTKAAIVGGTTTILDFATQNKGESLEDALNNWHKKAQDKAYCDYGFHMAITDWNEKVSKDMQLMIDEGVTSFKMYMAYKNLMVKDREIYEALVRSKEIGGLIGFHCENGDIIDALVDNAKKNHKTKPYYHFKTRPACLESEAINRLASIGEVAKAPVWIVHLSTEMGLKEVKKARAKGVEVVLESCPQYLLLDNSYYGKETDESFEAAKYVMSPPLRGKDDNEALWEGIRDGDIDFLGTDHCSFNYKGQKDLGIDDFSKIPNGGPGVEHRVYLMYTYGVCEGKISINDMCRLVSTNAAKNFGLYPKKGIIQVGSDADLVVLNPNTETIITKDKQTQNVDYTPYEGFKRKGSIEHVFLRGNEVVKDEKFIDNSPIGIYQRRNVRRFN